MEHFIGFQWPQNFNILVYSGLLFLLSQAAGRLAVWLGAPRLIGYLMSGILFGPSVLKLFSKTLIHGQLGLITDIALAIIAFSIGGALQLEPLKSIKKSVAWITILQAFGAFAVVFILVITFLPMLIPLSDVAGFQKTYLPFALVLGAVSVATAPAAILSLVHELKAKGPFTTTLLGVVALDDAVAIMVYGYVIVWVKALMGGQSSSWSITLAAPLISIAFSVVIGLVVGFVLIRIIKYAGPRDVMLGFILGAILLTGGLAASFGVSSLLATMVLGFMIGNFAAHDRASEALDVVEKIEEPIFGIFFLLAGAHLNLDVGFLALGVALIVLGGRFIGKLLGSKLGARLGGAPLEVRKYLGLALLPSAGVAIGLVLDAKVFIDTVSPMLGAVIVSTVLGNTLINEIFTPFLVRFAMIKAGETNIDKARFHPPLTLHGRMGSIIGHRKKKP
ncbi:MAG: cation:proton antiporter [Candidatus Aminicenantaceae bacterium]